MRIRKEVLVDGSGMCVETVGKLEMVCPAPRNPLIYHVHAAALRDILYYVSYCT